MWTNRAIASTVGVLVLACGMVGCSNARTIDMTGGVRCTVMLADAQSSRFERFELLEDGVFKWGGGVDALHEETTWSTQLDAPSAMRLVTLMHERGWIPGPPAESDPSTAPAAGTRSSTEELTVSGRADGDRFRWSRRSSDVASAVEVLGAFSNAAAERDAQRVKELVRPRTR